MGARPFVGVKFSPIGRTVTFLVPELDLDAADFGAAAGSETPSVPRPAGHEGEIPGAGEAIVV